MRSALRCVALGLALWAAAAKPEKLRFGEDGTFKIIHFTDVRGPWGARTGGARATVVARRVCLCGSLDLPPRGAKASARACNARQLGSRQAGRQTRRRRRARRAVLHRRRPCAPLASLQPHTSESAEKDKKTAEVRCDARGKSSSQEAGLLRCPTACCRCVPRAAARQIPTHACPTPRASAPDRS